MLFFLLVRDRYAAHRTAGRFDRLDRAVIPEPDAAPRRETRKLLSEATRIARLVARRVDAAGDRDLGLPQRGLEREALGRRLHLPFDAERARGFRVAREHLEIVAVGGEMQDAAAQVVIAQPGLLAHLAQAVAAVLREPGERAAVALEAAREAFEDEAQAPHPLRPVRARPEKQRRVLAPEPAQDLGQHRGLRPRLGVAGRDLAAVRERGFHRGARLALDHADLVARLGEVPGAGHADYAGAENEHFHSIIIAPCLFSPSASAGPSCAASITSSRTTRRSWAASCSKTTSTSGSRPSSGRITTR